MLFLRNFLSYFILAFIVIVLLFSPSVSAADFVNTNNIGDTIITEPKKNLYTLGNDISIESDIEEDVFAVGQGITINSQSITGGILVVGNKIDLSIANVERSVRVIGSEVRLTGYYFSDVIIIAQNVQIDNAWIAGDLIVGSDIFSMSHSAVKGDFSGGYSSYSGDSLDDQVHGDIKQTIDSSYFQWSSYMGIGLEKTTSNPMLVKFLLWDFGSILLTTVLALFLYKRRRLKNKEISLNVDIIFDLFKGLGYIAGPVLFFILSVITFGALLLHTILITALIWIFLALSSIYLPIFIANIVANSFGIKLKFGIIIIISIIFLYFINLVPVVGRYIYIILFATNFGYLVSSFFRIVNKSLLREDV